MDNLGDFVKVITDNPLTALLALLPVYVAYRFNKWYNGTKQIPGIFIYYIMTL